MPVSFPGHIGFFVLEKNRGQVIGSTLAKAASKIMLKNAPSKTFPVIELSDRAYKLLCRTNPKLPVMDGWCSGVRQRSECINFYTRLIEKPPKWLPPLVVSEKMPLLTLEQISNKSKIRLKI